MNDEKLVVGDTVTLKADNSRRFTLTKIDSDTGICFDPQLMKNVPIPLVALEKAKPKQRPRIATNI